MSWETVEEWPSQGAAGVYRGAAEIIVAERAGLTVLERVILWWHSTTDLPFGDIAKDVVVTPNYVYARKQDGTQMRVRRDLLAQGQVEGRRRQYSVPNGTDLVLSDRHGDDVELALMGDEEVKGWTSSARWGGTFLVLAGMSWWAFLITHEYLREGSDAVRAGRYNSESAYWFYTCIGAWFLVAATFFFFPRRRIVDALGIRTVRGLLRGIRSTIPVEDIRYVEVQQERVTNPNFTTYHYPVYVYTTHRSDKQIRLRKFEGPHQAIEFAELCARLWKVERKGPPSASS